MQQIQRSLASVRLATDHLAELADKLLVWTRHEEVGATASKPIVSDLPMWAERAMPLLRDAIQAADSPRPANEIELELEIHNAPPQIRIDPDLLQQAVLTLVLNARDAMPGGGRIRISLNRSPDGWQGSRPVERDDAATATNAEAPPRASAPDCTSRDDAPTRTRRSGLGDRSDSYRTGRNLLHAVQPA